MNSRELHRLLNFNFWARDRMLEAVEKLSVEQFTRDLGSSFPSVKDTLFHIYLAEWIWCQRLRGESPAARPSAEGLPDLPSLRSAWGELEVSLRATVDALAARDREAVISYRDMQGVLRNRFFWEIVQHAVNHATYHRGQVTTLLRQLGAEPPASTDLIGFYREQDEVIP